MPSARRVRWAKLRVTVTVVTAAAIVATLAYLLTAGLLFTRMATLYLYMPDANGLAAGSPVRVHGIDVGKVATVTLSRSKQPERTVKAAMTIIHAHLREIPSDSFAEIATDSMVGDVFVDITGGTSHATAADGAEIAFRGEPEFLKSIDMGEFERRLRQVDGSITEIEQGKSLVGQLVVGESYYADLRRRLGDMERGLREAQDSTTAAGKLIYTDALDRQLLEPLRQLDDTLAEWQAGEGATGKFLKDNAQYDDMRGQVAGLRKSIEQMRGQPWLTQDAEYTDWNHTLATILGKLDDFNSSPAATSSAMYNELNSAFKDLAASLKDFHENPRKYLHAKVF